MARKRGPPKAFLVVALLLLCGGAVVGVVIPALRGSGEELSSSTAATVRTPLTTILGGLTSAVASFAGSNTAATTGAPTTTILGVSATTMTTTASSTVSASQAQGETSTTSGSDIEFFGNLTINVSQSSASEQKASEIAASLGGYVAASTYSEGYATMTIRVPSANFGDAMTQLEGLGSVISSSSSSDDVAVQYSDLNATLQSLLTEQASLLKLLSESNSINATLDLESVLQKTDAQVNAVESSILETAGLIQYATIGIDFQTSVPVTIVPLHVKLSATPLDGMSPLSVTFNAVVTGGVEPYIVNFNFGDGTSAQGQQLIHQFTQPGRYNVTVSATDQTGNVSLAWIMVDVKSPPVSSGLSAFGASVWSLFSGVVEGIVEVAAVVLPIFLVLYVAILPAYRRLSRSKGGDGSPPAPVATP